MSEEWQEAALARLQARIWVRKARKRLPLSREDAGRLASDKPPPGAKTPVSSHAIVIQLQDDAAWIELHLQFTLGAQLYLGPWNRCLSLLRASGAKTCVIEEYYICLDYKSEMLSFYSQLDASRQVTATRLHFFKDAVSESEIFDLGDKSDSYLGYIVCRHGNLPLVGRSNIAAPKYIDVVASIEETVHFFGQQLKVIGVPFMQQDSQFAVCSQVTVWAAHYAAYRRGIVQRRLVAEIVAMSGAIEPMKPHVSVGLQSEDVAALFHKSGLSARTYFTPRGGEIDLPAIDISSVSGASEIVDNIREIFTELNNGEDDAIGFESMRDPSVDLAEFATDIAKYVDSAHADEPLRKEATALFDLILGFVFTPYLRSRIPIYSGTRDHSVLLCGVTADENGKNTYFVHDDNYGPYLALDSLIDGCRTSLIDQAYDCAPYPEVLVRDSLSNEDSNEGSLFPIDRTESVVFGSPHAGVDVDRAMEVFVVPGPPRLILTPAEAEADTFRVFANELKSLPTSDGTEWVWSARTSIIMGIDYKGIRISDLVNRLDPTGAKVYASIHLSEWVVVVEGIDGDGHVSWEVVYDGSSGSTNTIIQLARFGDSVMVDHPDAKGVCEQATLKSGIMIPLVVPPRIGKSF